MSAVTVLRARMSQRRVTTLRALIMVVLLSSCTTPGGNAAVWTAIALSASAVNRATGGCYASCSEGTVCNPESGLCEVLPCRGQCSEEERCDDSGFVERCVAKKTPDIVIEKDEEVHPGEVESQQGK
jgi:hypothetical protein